MKNDFIVAIMVVVLFFFAILLGFNAGNNQSCPVAEVYMTGNIQEDDLFIPASSIGKVDLKR